jgi:peptidoglycan-N-acetylglucosamine deacetylase
MLNFKSATLLLIVILIMIGLSGLFNSIPIWLFVIPILPYLILIVYGSATIGSSFFMPVICNGDKTINEVALTFDDGPAPKTTDTILDILKKNQVPAAFFMIGERAVEHPHLVQRIADEGHLIGNHSYSHHALFDLFPRSEMVRELRATNKAIEKMVRKRVHLFRPPYGVTTPALAKAVSKTKMTPVGWSLRSFDTVAKSPDQLINKINKQVKPGDVILLHDTKAVTAEALQNIIDAIRQKGLKIVPVDELLKINAYV